LISGQEAGRRGDQVLLGGDHMPAVLEAAAEVEEGGVVEEVLQGGEEGAVLGVEVPTDLVGEDSDPGPEGVGGGGRGGGGRREPRW